MKKEFLHTLPADLKKALAAAPKAKAAWNGITPLARNEWICCVTIIKKPETRNEFCTGANWTKGKSRH